MSTKNQTSRETGDRATAAYDRLRELILHGQLAPGSRIVETEVAEKLGLSRTPVRSALQRLHQEGFIVGGREGVRARPTVSPLTRDDAGEIFEIVGALEGLAAARAARLPAAEREAVVQRLEDANRRLSELQTATHHASDGFFELDTEFHGAYVDAAAGDRLRALHGIVKPQAERYMRLYVSVLTGKIQNSVDEHERIIDAIRGGDPDRALNSALENWRNAAKRLNRVIDSVGERGSW